MFWSVVELRLHFSAPLLGVFVMHLLHFFRHVWVLVHDVFAHLLHHLVPRIGRKLLVTGSAQLSASQYFHRRPPVLFATDASNRVEASQYSRSCSFCSPDRVARFDSVLGRNMEGSQTLSTAKNDF